MVGQRHGHSFGQEGRHRDALWLHLFIKRVQLFGGDRVTDTEASTARLASILRFTAPCRVLNATVSPGRPKLLPAGAAAAGAPAELEDPPAAGPVPSATRGTEIGCPVACSTSSAGFDHGDHFHEPWRGRHPFERPTFLARGLATMRPSFTTGAATTGGAAGAGDGVGVWTAAGVELGVGVGAGPQLPRPLELLARWLSRQQSQLLFPQSNRWFPPPVPCCQLASEPQPESILKRLNVHVGLIRLHHQNRFTAGDLVARLFQPLDDLALRHGGAKGRHKDVVVAIYQSGTGFRMVSNQVSNLDPTHLSTLDLQFTPKNQPLHSTPSTTHLNQNPRVARRQELPSQLGFSRVQTLYG